MNLRENYKAIYLDRSGSMTSQDDLLEQWLEIADCYPDAELFAFDDKPPWRIVDTANLEPLGGTRWPVAHAAERTPALILTDGLIGLPAQELALLSKVDVFLWDDGHPDGVSVRDLWEA